MLVSAWFILLLFHIIVVYVEFLSDVEMTKQKTRKVTLKLVTALQLTEIKNNRP